MNKLTTFDLRVPLTSAAHTIALQFAAEQDNPIKGKQVYLNTLAVIAVQKSLSWVGVESDFATSDCFNPRKRAIFDVADLFLPGTDRPIIECRPVLPNQTQIIIPPEAIEDRLGCVAVEFYPHMNNVKMRGFKEFKESEEIEEKYIAIESFDRFATIFDCLPNINYSNSMDDEWRDPQYFHLQAPVFANANTSNENSSTSWKSKEIILYDRENSLKKIIIMSFRIFNSSPTILFTPSNNSRKLPSNLDINIVTKNGVIPNHSEKSIGGLLDYKIEINGLKKGDLFSVKFKLNKYSYTEKFVI